MVLPQPGNATVFSSVDSHPASAKRLLELLVANVRACLRARVCLPV